jgi:pyruvate formate lyase activating enzyme
MKREVMGRIHSVETLGTHDGPGLRCIFFLAGCNFRCQFCHNPDTWTAGGSQRMTLGQARKRLEPLVPYLQNGGGITASGGEPLLQPEFVLGLFAIAHSLRLTTVLDTNGSCGKVWWEKILNATDIVLLDIKASTPALHKKLTAASLMPVLEFGRLAAQKPGRLTVRRVILPGINDTPEEQAALLAYLRTLDHPPKLEFLPYHRLGVHKWRELNLDYQLKSLRSPSPKKVKQIQGYFKAAGF